jgi:hypothetical protein
MVYTAGYLVDLDAMMFNLVGHSKHNPLNLQTLAAVKKLACKRLPFANFHWARKHELEPVR